MSDPTQAENKTGSSSESSDVSIEKIDSENHAVILEAATDNSNNVVAGAKVYSNNKN